MNKIGSNTKGKQKDEVKTYTHERTGSNQEKKRISNYTDFLSKGKDDTMMGRKLTYNRPR